MQIILKTRIVNLEKLNLQKFQKMVRASQEDPNFQSEVEETFNRIKTHKSVKGIVICNDDGKIIRSTYTDKKEEGENLAKLIPPLCQKAKMTVLGLNKEVP